MLSNLQIKAIRRRLHRLGYKKQDATMLVEWIGARPFGARHLLSPRKKLIHILSCWDVWPVYYNI